MKWLWEKIGIAAFWLSWPVLHIYLRLGTRAKILVLCGDQVLVVKNWLFGGGWSLPGGGVRRGEEPLQAAIRELREETGLVLAQRPKLLYEDVYRQYGIRFSYKCFAAQLEATPQPHVRRPELVSAEWRDRHELLSEYAGPDVRNAIRQWYKR